VFSQGQAELNQFMVFSLSRSDSVQVRFNWGIAGAIPMMYTPQEKQEQGKKKLKHV
jgi:hypothetical protein